jgi:hypothetical protein
MQVHMERLAATACLPKRVAHAAYVVFCSASAVLHVSWLQAVSYVSRRRLDADDFDPDAVDEEGLPLVYNEARIAAFWSKRPGELASRWTRFAAISGERIILLLIVLLFVLL